MINVILAAGYATRLYPLTENFPKALLKVGGQTILDALMTDIDAHPAITGHVIISNHRFIDHFCAWQSENQHRFKSIRVIDDGSVCNDDRLGAVRDLQFAMESLDLKEDLLVLAGDNMLDFSLKSFVDFAIEKRASCVTCYCEPDPEKQKRTAIITTDDTDRILEYAEKPGRPKNDLAVPPFYVYRREDAWLVGQAIEEGCAVDAPGSFAAWLSRKVPMYAWRFPENCHRYDIGNLQSYEAANRLFSAK